MSFILSGQSIEYTFWMWRSVSARTTKCVCFFLSVSMFECIGGFFNDATLDAIQYGLYRWIKRTEPVNYSRCPAILFGVCVVKISGFICIRTHSCILCVIFCYSICEFVWWIPMWMAQKSLNFSSFIFFFFFQSVFFFFCVYVCKRRSCIDMRVPLCVIVYFKSLTVQLFIYLI